MAQQLALPGINRAPSRSDVKAWVAYKMAGFELRQDARTAKRVRKLKARKRNRAEQKVLGGGRPGDVD